MDMTRVVRTVPLMCPVGCIIEHFALSHSWMFIVWEPGKAILCDGNRYSIDTYPKLFEAIGHHWGGKGCCFRVPRLTALSKEYGQYIEELWC